MAAFDLPLTVAVHADPVTGRPAALVRLLVELPGPMPWSAVAGHVCRAAGLPATTVLHLGPGPVGGEWPVGHPPLLAGVELATHPDRRPRVSGLMELACIAGPDAGRAVPLLDDPVVIGRDPTAGLPVADPELSYRHADIRVTGDGPRVYDLASTNGIIVDGHRRPSGTVLPAGSILRLGSSLFQVRLAVEAPASRTPDGNGRLLVAPSARLRATWAPLIPAPPGPAPTRTRRPLPLVAAVIGVGLGAVLAAVTGSMLFLAFAALGPATMLATAVADRIGGRRGHRFALEAHAAAIRRHRRALADLIRTDRIDDWEAHPDPAACLARIERCASRLWERDDAAPDLGVVVVGCGSRPVRAADELRPVADPDTTFGLVTDIPVTIDLRQLDTLGLVGPPEATGALLRALLLQLLALHPPGAVVVRGFDLQPSPPHATAAAGAGSLVIEDGLTEPAPGRMAGGARPKGGPGHRVRVFTARSTHLLPAGCDAVLRVGAGRLRLFGTAGGRADGPVETIGVRAQVLARACSALAPLALRGAPGAGTGGLRSGGPDPAGAAAGWTPERWTRPGATAILGFGRTGAVAVDLDADGPHLLIAGTTGSGKSELLITLAAGLATAAPPRHTSLLLVDYKGGAGFAAIAGLPHVVATLTDLDQAAAERGLAGLRAELRRRERVLAVAGAPDLRTLRALDADGAPARLVILVDEFATLAAELPEFLAGLIDIAQRGRSLGLHLVLATQRPGGVVSPTIRANISTRICLRVVDEAESRDVLGIPDAAWLDPARPGQALLRTANGPLAPFQVTRLTEPVRTGLRVRRTGPGVPIGGTGEAQANEAGPNPTRSPLQLALAAIQHAIGDHARPPAPWLPELPTRLSIRDPGALGLIDLPDVQEQPTLPAPSVLVVAGPPGSGRSTALLRWAGAMVAAGSDLLVVDPAGALAELVGRPATSTSLDAGEPGLVLRLLDRLTERLRLGSDAQGPRVALVVDCWESVATVLDRCDPGAWTAQLVDLLIRGPVGGISVAIAGGPALLHHRLAAAATETVLLGAPDHRAQCRPGAPPGRGRRSGGTGPEFQIALPVPADPAAPADPGGHRSERPVGGPTAATPRAPLGRRSGRHCRPRRPGRARRRRRRCATGHGRPEHRQGLRGPRWTGQWREHRGRHRRPRCGAIRDAGAGGAAGGAGWVGCPADRSRDEREVVADRLGRPAASVPGRPRWPARPAGGRLRAATRPARRAARRAGGHLPAGGRSRTDPRAQVPVSTPPSGPAAAGRWRPPWGRAARCCCSPNRPTPGCSGRGSRVLRRRSGPVEVSWSTPASRSPSRSRWRTVTERDVRYIIELVESSGIYLASAGIVSVEI